MNVQQGGEQSPPPYRRRPTSLQGWLRRAELDFALLGRVERVLAMPPEVMSAMIRLEAAEYVELLQRLADLQHRLGAAVDAASEARRKVECGAKMLGE